MFDLDSCIRDALVIAQDRMASFSGWERIREELLDPSVPARRKKRLLTLLGPAVGEALIGPQMVLLDITGRCNANCVFCRDHSPRIDDREAWRDMEMNPEFIFRLIGEIEELGGEKIPILAAGEPTLHAHFPEIVKRLNASPMAWEVFTNGIVLKDAVLDLLSRAGNCRIYFSVSAARNETFVAQRPGMKGDLLGRVEENIRMLARARSAKKPRIAIVNVVNSGNFREVIPMMEKAIELGVDEVQYKLTEISEISRDMNLRPEQLKCLELEMRHAKNLAGAAGIDVQDNIDVQLAWVNPVNGNYTEGMYDRIPCRVGYEFARVRRDGMASFCCGLKFFCNLTEMSLKEHWQGPAMRDARRAAMDFPKGANLRIPDGGMLRDEQCEYCYNYILNVHAQREWKEIAEDNGAQ
jgi:MoaA/NifB/PqqE/SkfB family radical SAM enzyme